MNLPEQLIQWCQQRQAKSCHRQLLVITGQEQWTVDTANSLVDRNNIKDILWVGDTESENDCISIKNYRSKLGHEYQWVILNCFSGFRANTAMALSGTIKANGLMIILCPELCQWPSYADPELINRISFGFNQKYTHSYFIQHLISSLKEDKTVALLSKVGFSGSVSYVPNNTWDNLFNEQQLAVESIRKVALGHRNRPLVLTADRGRGKSSALGIAAADLIRSSAKTICITAPHINNIEQVFFHIKRLLPEVTESSNSVSYLSGSLTFKPIDVILEENSHIDLLLVDEASAMPIHLLCKLAKKFSRIVFSSTIHGYEGSGRGFEMRFLKQLSQLKPDYKRVEISQPIRWYKGDTLEQFWFNTLFHNTKHEAKIHDETNQPIICRGISKQELIDDKDLLADLFRLLINAHYQTSQDDLQRMLDAPELQCFILTKGVTLLGVVQIIEEGGRFFGELADNIANCSRRVKGHLVAQSITSSYNMASFVLARQWRISRIAIEPEYQRKGYGKKLINFVEQQAIQHNIEFLTTSFGCNSDILRFWHSSEFVLTKLSSKPEISSGEHSGICIKALADKQQQRIKNLNKEFYQELIYQLDKNFQWMSEGLIKQLLIFMPSTAISFSKELEIIEQFASGKRTYSTCKRLLREYLINSPLDFSRIDIDKQALLVAAFLQNKTDKELCEKFKLSGKKHIEQRLKISFKQMLRNAL
ncbi:tRNA(Met) cytidine acetyltransferase TmcA [Paraglaciecola arctica]|uniref:tRNA(Met) cytidine acetyltransferase TmcA n=1 Tax=Paraglaciecola arctica TaxID=1128911 RepID=UPI001C07A339|nr:GNAT family N-acetyltransferase [Paraglaciecola arctica]